MLNNIDSGQEAKAWLKRINGSGEIVRIVFEIEGTIRCYQLYAAYEREYYGRILFDVQNYWIYDGSILNIDEQEHLAKFIIKWNN
ncbi:hypothetical protein ACFGVR_16100 [Mucilaginibacter sp. AW1-3]